MSRIKNLKQNLKKALLCCTILDVSLITKREKFLWRSVIFSWRTATLQIKHFPATVFDEETKVPSSRNITYTKPKTKY